MVGSNSSSLGRSVLCESLESRQFFSSTVGLDGSFGSGGVLTTRFFASGIESATGVVTLKDGRVLVSGIAYQVKGDFHDIFAVYNANGSLSTSFAGNGKLILPADQTAKLGDSPTVSLLKDGNVLVTGTGNFMKLKLNGQVDTSFGKGGFAAQPNAPGSDVRADGNLTEQSEVLSDGTIRYASYDYSDGLLRVADYSTGGQQTKSIRRTVDRSAALTLTPTDEILTFNGSLKVKEYRSDLSIESKFGVGGTLDLTPAFNAFVKANGPFTQDNGTATPETTQLLTLSTKAGYVFSTEVYSTSPKLPYVPYKYGAFTLVNFYAATTGTSVKVTGGPVDGTQLPTTNFTREPQTTTDPDTVTGTFNTTGEKTVSLVLPALNGKTFDPAAYSASGGGKFYLAGYLYEPGSDGDFAVVRTAGVA